MTLSGLRSAMLFGIGAVALTFVLLPFTEESELSAPSINGGFMVIKVAGRRLKEEDYGGGIDKRTDGAVRDMEDYSPIDPVPASKKSIRAGPIDHGTPVIPYLPDPATPNPPKPGG